MPVLHRDFETRSTVSLSTAGSWRYAADPSTEILCVAFAVDDEPVKLWAPGQPIPEEFFAAAARDPEWIVVAHNDQFETAIEECLLNPRYSWPIAPMEIHRCTMAAALASALPGALDGACAALGMDISKDAEGHRLMRQMSKPRKPRKSEDASEVRWIDGPEHRARLAQYCLRDVELERELHRRLRPLSADEQLTWELDALINRRGFFVDRELAESARKIVEAEQAAIDIEITEITGGEITSINQVAKLSVLLRGRGHDVHDITKQSIEALLAKQLDGDIQRLLTLRQDGGRAASRKLDSLLFGADTDQRLRGCFRFHGAATGRWSGSRFQPQNLKKSSLAALDGAIAAVRSSDLAQVRALGPPLAVVGDLSRAMILAKPGYDLVGADFSAIESRVLAWLADETWKLGTYRKFDSTSDPADEPYCVTASRILRRPVTPEDKAGRQIGKTADLALGYGGGLGAWRRFATSDTRSDADIQRNIADWRRAHPAICNLWKTLEGAAHRCIRSGLPVKLGRVSFEMRDGDVLMVLPSGRRIAYPEAKLVAGKFDGTFQITAKDNAKGAWADGKVWYGTLVENLVQAVSRDLLAAAMLRLEAADYQVVMHCHDEIVAETRKGRGSTDEFLWLMTELPAWAEGLPIAAKPWRRECYAEPAEMPVSAAPPPPAPSAWLFTPKTAPSAWPLQATDPNVAPIEQAKNSELVLLTDLISDIGADGKRLCPFHADTKPSLHVYDHHFHCFACGAHGDDIDWLMLIDGVSRDRALAVLENRSGAIKISRPTQPARDPAQTLKGALALWDAAKPISGTLAVRYLEEVRSIDVNALPKDDATLRFHPQCPFGVGRLEPCLVALYRDVATDEPAGIHRIALTPKVFAGAKVQRLTLGTWPRPRAIKIWPTNGRLFLGEGVETVLAAATVLNHRPAWAAGSANNIAKFPVLRGVDLTVLADHDETGIAAAKSCRDRYRQYGRDVRCLRPKQQGTDFNDVVRVIAQKAMT
jgi:Toprim domain/CHC2 zinc finger/DNA polymerase family A